MSRAAIASIVALVSLVAVAPAGAAGWLGPVTLSQPSVNAGDIPTVSLGSGGDAAAGWWDQTNAQLVLMRRSVAGTAWSPTTSMAASSSSTPVLTGVDSAGDVTAATTTGVTPVTTVANWSANATTPTLTDLPVPGGLTVLDLAVDPNGDAVLAGLTGTDLVLGYRTGFNGSFALRTFTGSNATTAKAAISTAGKAIVIYRDNTAHLFSLSRTPATDWPAAGETVSDKIVQDDTTTTPTTTMVPTVGIDAAGNAFTAFIFLNLSGAKVVHAAYEPAGTSGWLESGDLSNAGSQWVAAQVQVAVNPSGWALMVWKQLAPDLVNYSIQARFGTTATGLWGAVEQVNDAGADVPVVAMDISGRAGVAWERETSSGKVGQARIREPGPGGVWGDIHTLNQQHTANYAKPSISADYSNNFLVATSPNLGTGEPLLASVYDVAPPTLTPITVTGGQLAGDAVGLAVTASDRWSGVGTPAWTFGDGTTGTGATVSHLYTNAGTYTAHVSVTDSSANTAGEDVTVVVSAAQSKLTTTKFTAKWKQSKISGTLRVAGTAPREGTYAIDIKRGKKSISHLSLKLPAGAFTHTFKLTSKFLPGTYDIALVPAVPATQITPAAGSAVLKAPPQGVVDVAFMTGARNGTAARTLTGTSTIWASFHFAAKTKGKLTLTWYKLGSTRVRLGSTSKDAATKVVSYIKSAAAFKGKYQAVLSRKGVVISQVSVTTK